MKKSLLFNYLFFVLLVANGQDSLNFSFFEVSYQEGGKHFAMALTPVVYDTIVKQNLHKEVKWVEESREVVDTLYLFNYYWLPDKSDYGFIKEYGDTLTNQIMTFKGYERTNAIRKSYAETSTEQTFLKPENTKWTIKENQSANLLDPKNWSLKSYAQEYMVVKVRRVPFPVGTTSTSIPSEYITKLTFLPHPNLSEESIAIIEQYCSNQFTSTRTQKNWVKDGRTSYSDFTRHLEIKQQAGINQVEVYSKKQIKRMVPELKNALAIKNPQKGINNSLKKAIINYQQQNQLPIGQFDKKTINHVLKK